MAVKERVREILKKKFEAHRVQGPWLNGYLIQFQQIDPFIEEVADEIVPEIPRSHDLESIILSVLMSKQGKNARSKQDLARSIEKAILDESSH